LSIWERLTLMKNKALSVLAVALLTSIAALWASDSTGRWFARIPDEETVLKRFVERVGPQTVFTFRVDGTELLGTVSYPPGEEVSIKDGKINGDQISFVVIKERGMRLVYKGIVAENEIKLTQEIQGEDSPQEFIAEREFQRNGDVPLRIQKPGSKSP
jgi:hypothetical protein